MYYLYYNAIGGRSYGADLINQMARNVGRDTFELAFSLKESIVQIQLGSPHWKHPELLFEKKQLVPALQQLLTQANRTL